MTMVDWCCILPATTIQFCRWNKYCLELHHYRLVNMTATPPRCLTLYKREPEVSSGSTAVLVQLRAVGLLHEKLKQAYKVAM